LQKQPHTSYNWFFLLPFLVWVAVGYTMIDPKYLQRYFALINTHNTPFTDVLMYYATDLGEGLIITVIMILMLGFSALRNWWFALSALLCNLLPALLTQIVKHATVAPRPLKYFGEPAWVHIEPSWPHLYSQSFPSGHTTGAFSMFCFLSLLLPARYKYFGFIFFLMALLVGYSRIYLAAHFLEDVYAGSLIGCIGTLLIFAIMKHYQKYFFKQKDKPVLS
jgi:membrane-associated phospholipid phosphatase